MALPRHDHVDQQLSDRHFSRRRLIGTGAGLAAGLAASRPGTSVAQIATPVATAGPATPERVAAAVADLEHLAQETVESGGVPGLAIAVVHQDGVVALAGFGVRSVDAPKPVDTETVFQLASVSKSLASTTVAAVVGDGHVTWDDRVIDHLPDFRLSDPWVTREVTIRDCFCHRTGMPGTAGDDLEGLGFDRDEIIRQMRALNLTGKFRQTSSYNNHGLTAGAVAAAAATGETWEDLAANRLYAPLGMTPTSSRYADFAARENRALLHTRVAGQWRQQFTRQPDAQAPAGGVSSSITDMAQWVRLVLGDGTVDGAEHVDGAALAATQVPQIMTGPNPATGKPAFYGLGWAVRFDDQGRIRLNHAGAFSVGARTVVTLIPEDQLGIVVLANAFPTGVPDGLAATFFDLVFYGSSTRDWLGFWNGAYDSMAQGFEAPGAAYVTPPVSPSPALPAAAYVGRYVNDYFGELTVEGNSDALTVALGPGPVSYGLQHWDRDRFVYEPAPEFPGVMSGAVFSIGPDGQATRVTLESLDDYGQGTFTRADRAE